MIDVDKLLAERYLVFDGEFEAFTPWWGGNEFGYTFYPEPHYPEPKSLIGKTKWTIRAVHGSVPKELGSTEMASRVKVKIEVVSKGEKYFNSVPNVDDMIGRDRLLRGRGREGEESERKAYSKLLQDMRETGYSLLFPGYVPKNRLPSKGFEELYKLLAIPRFYLKAMGRKGQKPSDIMQELLKSQPMRPGFKIRIRVMGKEKEVARLFVNSMIATLKYLGIGSAANRGFGRFKLVKVNYSIDGVDEEARWFEEKLPVRLVKPVHAYIKGRKYGVRDIEGVLAAIGIATLKSTWKSVCRNLTGSGRDYHTWVLGLPREVNGRGYVSDSQRRQSYIVLSPTEDLGVLLIPFYAEDYTKKIFHKDHGQVEVTKINIRKPDCSTVKPSSSVKDHIDVALEWLEEVLG